MELKPQVKPEYNKCSDTSTNNGKIRRQKDKEKLKL